jgi:large repetitive protein
MTHHRLRKISWFVMAVAAAGCGTVAAPPADVDAGGSAEADAAAAPDLDADSLDVDAAIAEPDAPPPPVVPDTTIISGPTGLVATRGATFTFSSDQAGATFTCQVDHDAPAPCTSPASITVTSDGAHTFAVAATLAAETDDSPASSSWAVDTGAPVVTITSGPADPTNQLAASFAFTADADASLKCALDTGPFVTCASPQAFTGLAANASHKFQILATDPAGNTSVQGYAWGIDTKPPVVTITKAPTNPSKSTSAFFTFTTEPGAIVHCGLDAIKIGPCTSATTMNIPKVVPGSHRFVVRSTDRAGNSADALYDWTVL